MNTGIAEMQFGRAETPKGIETQILLPDGISHMFRRAETPKGIETQSIQLIHPDH